MNRTYVMSEDDCRLAERAPEKWTGSTWGTSKRLDVVRVEVKQWNHMLSRMVVRVLDTKNMTVTFTDEVER
jgi:hypothetical protein